MNKIFCSLFLWAQSIYIYIYFPSCKCFRNLRKNKKRVERRKPGTVAHTCYPSTWEAKAEAGHEFEACLDCEKDFVSKKDE